VDVITTVRPIDRIYSSKGVSHRLYNLTRTDSKPSTQTSSSPSALASSKATAIIASLAKAINAKKAEKIKATRLPRYDKPFGLQVNCLRPASSSVFNDSLPTQRLLLTHSAFVLLKSPAPSRSSLLQKRNLKKSPPPSPLPNAQFSSNFSKLSEPPPQAADS